MIKKHKALMAYMLALALFTSYVVMDTFVITRVYGEAADSSAEAVTQIEEDNDDSAEQTDESDSDDAQEKHHRGPGGRHGDGKGGKHSGPESGSETTSEGDSAGSTTAEVSSETTADSYSDGRISIELKEYTVSGTAVYVTEVDAGSADCLKTAFAQGAYGKNVTATTSDIAGGVNAILAINGDYYGAREKGYVIRNGKLYRSTGESGQEDLVIYEDGSFEIIDEGEVTAEQLISKGAVQTLSFGPALVENGDVSVDSDDEVGRAMASNPRTAIGVKADGTYVFVVSDGRTDESEGLSLLQLAKFMKDLGVETAYNLDGGGSSTMVFNGSVVNTPTGGGIGNGSGSERKVSDIVYIGY